MLQNQSANESRILKKNTARWLRIQLRQIHRKNNVTINNFVENEHSIKVIVTWLQTTENWIGDKRVTTFYGQHEKTRTNCMLTVSNTVLIDNDELFVNILCRWIATLRHQRHQPFSNEMQIFIQELMNTWISINDFVVSFVFCMLQDENNVMKRMEINTCCAAGHTSHPHIVLNCNLIVISESFPAIVERNVVVLLVVHSYDENFKLLIEISIRRACCFQFQKPWNFCHKVFS